MASFTFPFPIFSLAFGQTASNRIAVGSMNDTGPINDVSILSLDIHNSAGEGTLTKAAVAPHPYPVTKVAFSPAPLLGNNSELLATSSDALRLWDIADSSGDSALSSKMTLRNTLSSQAKADYVAPLTSFSWSSVDPALILTASTNTTVTLWNIAQGQAVTQLIAHDKEVYDVSWCPPSAATGSSGQDVFASCGADGSVRMFDIRSLEHSTILYEAGPTSPSAASAAIKSEDAVPASSAVTPSLMRLAFDPLNPVALAIVHDQSSSCFLIDVRQPGLPVAELKAHQGSINGLAWSPGSSHDSGSALATVGDDGLVLIWDGASALAGGKTADKAFTKATQPAWTNADPMLVYEAGTEVNSVAWSGLAGTEVVGFTCGRTLRCLSV